MTTQSNFVSGPVASMPLAEAQQQAAAQAAAQSTSSQPSTGDQPGRYNTTIVGAPNPSMSAPPPVVVDLDLDELPQIDFTPITFRLFGVVYTLQLKDDNLLTELSEFSNSSDMSIVQLHGMFFEQTFLSAVDSDGTMLADGLDRLLNLLDEYDDKGVRVISLHSRSKILERAVSTWTEQLTDTSMRPMPRNRYDRRAASRKRG